MWRSILIHQNLKTNKIAPRPGNSKRPDTPHTLNGADSTVFNANSLVIDPFDSIECIVSRAIKCLKPNTSVAYSQKSHPQSNGMTKLLVQRNVQPSVMPKSTRGGMGSHPQGLAVNRYSLLFAPTPHHFLANVADFVNLALRPVRVWCRFSRENTFNFFLYFCPISLHCVGGVE